MTDSVRFLGLILLVLLAAYVGVGFLDLPEETKDRIRSSIAGAALGVLALLLFALTFTTLPAWAVYGSAVVAGAGAAALLTGAVSVPGPGAGSGSGSSGQPECVFPDDCGKLVGDRICLDLNCPTED